MGVFECSTREEIEDLRALQALGVAAMEGNVPGSIILLSQDSALTEGKGEKKDGDEEKSKEVPLLEGEDPDRVAKAMALIERSGLMPELRTADFLRQLLTARDEEVMREIIEERQRMQKDVMNTPTAGSVSDSDATESAGLSERELLEAFARAIGGEPGPYATIYY